MALRDRKKETEMQTPMDTCAQHYAELLSDGDGTATVLEINGTDITFEYDNGPDQLVGTLYDGESLADINWQYKS